MSDRRVTPWTQYSAEFEKSLTMGDLIEFNRGIYSHWAVYFKDGLVAHFNPADAGERVSPLDGEKFIPGAVTRKPVGEVAGSSKIRVNNKPEDRTALRPVPQISGLVKILTNKPGFYYSLFYFNCEHFATYCKFQGESESSQMNDVQAYLLTGGLTKLRVAGCSREALFSKGAYMQWWENTNKSYEKKMPEKILQNIILEWERA